MSRGKFTAESYSEKKIKNQLVFIKVMSEYRLARLLWPTM